MKVSFYSYKGGVGRSQALLNVAALLALRGVDVGMVDADLEAPGLHHILGARPAPHQSLIEHLVTQDLGAVAQRCMHIDYLASLGEGRRERLTKPGRLVLLPSIPDRMQLARIPESDHAVRFFEESLNLMRAEHGLKHLFLDTRTGFARFAALTLQVADIFVFVARLDDQNAAGIRELLRICEPRRVPKFLVASQMPKADDEISEDFLRSVVKRFENTVGHAVDVFVPFDKSLLLGDRIPALRYAETRPINQAFAQLAAMIDGSAQ